MKPEVGQCWQFPDGHKRFIVATNDGISGRILWSYQTPSGTTYGLYSCNVNTFRAWRTRDKATLVEGNP